VGLAEQARQSYTSLATVVDQRRQELARIAEQQERAAAAARQRVVEEINGLLPAAREALEAGDGLSRSGRRTLRSDRSRLEELVSDAAGAANSSRSQAELEALRNDLAAVTSTYRNGVNRVLAEESKPVPPTPTPVPTPTPMPTPMLEPTPTVDPLQRLRTASEAFLSGEYAAALAALETVEGEQRVAAVAHLVRAAASFSLYAAGGEGDEALLRAAESDVRSCRTTDPEVVPDERYFSPAFVGFFDRVGG
jgi:hypothetical protein